MSKNVVKRKNVSSKQEDISYQDLITVGSIIGNILQGIKQISTNNRLDIATQSINQLLRDRDTLLQQLEKWRKTYFSLKFRADALETKVLSTEKKLQEHQKELNKIKEDQTKKDKEIFELKKLNLKLKEENEKLKKEKK